MVFHVKIPRASVTIRIDAIGVVDVRGITAPDQYVLVRNRIFHASPCKESADDARRPRMNMLLFDPSGVLDHCRLVVEGDWLPDESSKILMVRFSLLIHRLHLGTELVNVEGKGFTDNSGNGLIWRCRRHRFLRTSRRRRRYRTYWAASRCRRVSNGLTRASRGGASLGKDNRTSSNGPGGSRHLRVSNRDCGRLS